MCKYVATCDADLVSCDEWMEKKVVCWFGEMASVLYLGREQQTCTSHITIYRYHMKINYAKANEFFFDIIGIITHVNSSVFLGHGLRMEFL